MRRGDQLRGRIGDEVVFKLIYAENAPANFEQLAHDDPDHLAQETVGGDLEPKFVPIWAYNQPGRHHIANRMLILIRTGAKGPVVFIIG